MFSFAVVSSASIRRACFALALLPFSLCATAQTHYEVQHISRPEGYLYYRPTSLNSMGQVAGNANNDMSSTYDAFVTKKNGKGVRLLPEPAGSDSDVHVAYINDSGIVAGSGNGNAHSYITDINGSFVTDLPTGDPASSLMGISNTGLVVGSRVGGNRDPETFVIDIATMKLSSLPYPGMPRAINDNGVVIGQNYQTSSAFASAPPYVEFKDLQPIWATGSQALAVNKKSQIVGYYTANGGQTRAFISQGSEPFTDLPVPAEYDATATGINDDGVIVGAFGHFLGGSASVFRCSGDCSDFVDLNDLVRLPHGARITQARAINTSGQILVQANNGKSYLLTPTP